LSFTSSILTNQILPKSAVARKYLTEITDACRSIDYINRVEYKSLVDSSKVSDYMCKFSLKSIFDVGRVFDYTLPNHILNLIDVVKVTELFRKAYIYSWTLRYGRTYQGWIDEKAKRLWNALNYFYIKKTAIDIQILLHIVYRERLWDFRKRSWKPIDDHLTNHKPSPFMKSFINYLIERLISDGYLMYGWIVECHDRVRVSDAYTPMKVERFRIYSVGLYHKVVEVNDCLRIVDSKLEYMPTAVKKTKVPMHITVELRDSIYIDDVNAVFEASITPPETKTKYVRGLIRMPSIEYLKDLCTWKDT